MIKSIAVGLILTFVCFSAYGNPPPAGSEDAKIMHDFGEWAEKQYSPKGTWCCNISDGRPLNDDEIRIINGQYQIFYSTKHWEDGTNQWIDVPHDAVMNTLSPVGYVIAWVINSHVYCLSLTGAS